MARCVGAPLGTGSAFLLAGTKCDVIIACDPGMISAPSDTAVTGDGISSLKESSGIGGEAMAASSLTVRASVEYSTGVRKRLITCRTYELALQPNWGGELADRLVIPCYGVSVV